MDFTLGYSGGYWLMAALILGLIGWGVIKLKLTQPQEKAVKAGTLVCLVISSIAFGVWAVTPEAPEGTVYMGGVEWDTTCTSDDAHVVKMSDYSFKVLCTYDISDGALTAATDDVTLNFVNTRADTSVVDATAICLITNYGIQVNSTTSQSYDGVAKNTDGSWNTIYTNSAGANTTTQIVVPTDKTTASDSFTLLITPNVNAITAAPLYGGYTITIDNAGQMYTIEFVHHATQA